MKAVREALDKVSLPAVLHDVPGGVGNARVKAKIGVPKHVGPSSDDTAAKLHSWPSSSTIAAEAASLRTYSLLADYAQHPDLAKLLGTEPALHRYCCAMSLLDSAQCKLQAQVDKKKVKEVLSTFAGKVDDPKVVRGGLRW